MAWTAPMTFVSGRALTAAQLNTFLRDNLMETEVAKVTSAGQYLVTAGRNRIESRTPTANRIDTDEATTSQEYIDLPTSGPTVTVTTGPFALVMFAVDMYQDNTNGLDNAASGASFAVSGATEMEPWDGYQAMTDGILKFQGNRIGNAAFLDTLNAGSNTFSMKYKVGNGQGHFRNRVLAVFPF